MKLSIESARLNAYVADQVAATAREAVEQGAEPVLVTMTSLTTSAHVMAHAVGPTATAIALRILATQFEAQAEYFGDPSVTKE